MAKKRKVEPEEPKPVIKKVAANLDRDSTRDENLHLLSTDPDRKNPDLKRARLPFDFPGNFQICRLMKEEATTEDAMLHKGYGRMEMPRSGLVGWVAEINMHTFGVKIFIRADMEGTLRVFAQDEDGTTKLEEWSK